MGEKRNIPIICGPTGSGKTSAAIELSRFFPVEIVSADSRQIIRNLNIGTAKPTAEEQALAIFHLIDIIDSGERYTAFRFIEDANKAITDILERKAIPVVVGGTGLYLRALTEGVVEIHADDLSIRERLEHEMETIGPLAMFEQLRQIDPAEAEKMHPHNRARIIRALEMYLLTGKTKTELAVTEKYVKSDHQFTYYCLTPNRESLYSRINDRVDAMMSVGWLEEIQSLIKRGHGEAIRKANIIGYSELLDHLEGKLTIEEAVSLIRQNTRRYAKRQLTWFRHQAECKYFERSEDLVNHLKPVLSAFLRSTV